MNSVVVTLCVLFALAVLPASAVRGALASGAASLLEATPLLLAGVALHAASARTPLGLRLRDTVLAHLGCGCASGASARSLPAAVAAGLAFGPLVALLRFGAATAVAWARHPSQHDDAGDVLEALRSLAAPATIGGVLAHSVGTLHLASLPPVVQWLAGAAAGSVAPCALGAVALASSLHARAPAAAFGMLCIGGIADVRTFRRRPRRRAGHDALAYACAAIAAALAAARDGATLLNPRFAVILGCAALACAALAVHHRRARSPLARVAPAIMLAGVLLAAPPPLYDATETTLGDVFAGERVTFTGQLARDGHADALVRYAITCCRADAAPVVLRLSRRLRSAAGNWILARGTIVVRGAAPILDVTSADRIAPPADPFVYR